MAQLLTISGRHYRPTGGPPAPFYDLNPTAMPTADMIIGSRKYVNVMNEDFNTDVAVGGFIPKPTDPLSGSLNQGGAADTPYGSKLMTYPSGFNASTYGKSRPEHVLSVSSSCLTYNFRIDATTGEYEAATVRYLVGSAVYNGAAPGYYVDPTVGGRFMFRFQIQSPATGLTGWGLVAQLIANSTDWSANHGELDILEGSPYGYAPHGMQTNFHPYRSTNDGVQSWSGLGGDWGQGVWHTVVADWIPVGDSLEPTGRETVWIDGVKIGEATTQVSQLWRGFFAFQSGVGSIPPAADGVTYPADGTTRGRVLVDWVSVYRPTTV